MSTRATQERIAQLQARAHAQRLAAQLAILEVREQLVPVRSAVGMIGAAARVFSPRGSAGGTIAALAKLGVSHPWFASAVAAVAMRMLRRRPLALLLAAAAGAAAWWLFRPAGKPGDPE